MARALFCVVRTGVLASECYVNACETIIMSANGTWIRKQKLGNFFFFSQRFDHFAPVVFCWNLNSFTDKGLYNEYVT